MIWRDAVLDALHRFSIRHSTKVIDRQQLIDDELEQIIKDVNSVGATPAQTLSRVLQELRDEGIIYFRDNSGSYLLADSIVHVEMQDLPNDAIDFAIKHNKLGIGIVKVDNQQALVRQRIGQNRLRSAALENYRNECAFCDIKDIELLIASHISRWSDDPDGRGDLKNIICMCSFHDVLFEKGYFSLTDDFTVLKKSQISSQTIRFMLDRTFEFRQPQAYPPSPLFLQKHRRRTGFQ